MSATTNKNIDIESLPNLASALLSSRIVFATDEWFASADRMLRDDEPVWREEEFSKCGKWMDGWECRRRRSEGHDWSIIKLGCPGIIRAIEVDTRHFTGNFSPKVSIQGAYIQESLESEEKLFALRDATYDPSDDNGRMGLAASLEEIELVKDILHAGCKNKSKSKDDIAEEDWIEVVPLSPLGAGYQETSKTIFYLTEEQSKNLVGNVTHLRINMGPDGGIARVRVYGEVIVNQEKFRHSTSPIDLISVENGGLSIACSNKHYGHPRNLMAPGRGLVMGDGWETARQPKRPHKYKRGSDGLMILPGSDWVILKLGIPGVIESVEVDTNFFAGNYPESCTIVGCNASGTSVTDDDFRSVAEASILAYNAAATSEEAVKVVCPTPQGIMSRSPSAADGWDIILPRVRLGPSQVHSFKQSDLQCGNASFTHIKLIIYPDGGIMRIRLNGKPIFSNNHISSRL